MSNDESSTQVAVVGGGPGGYAAAFMAADLGMDVTLIDVEPNPGGTCLYRGCIPSKALLHAAKVITEAREAKHWGITFGDPEVDLERLREATGEVVGHMTVGLGQLCSARKVRYIQGRAIFTDSKTLSITQEDGTQQTLRTEHTVLATGSRPALFGPPIDSDRIMNSTGGLELEDVPKTLLVLGGGYIGLELGTVYATLGSQVSVVEMMPTLLAGADRDLVAPLQARLENLFHEILLSTKVVSISVQKNGIKVKLEGEGIKKPTRVFDKVLVCVGRKPNSSGLSLKSTKVELDERGFVKVDEQLRTADPSIFAIGDLVGGPMLAHKASHEGRVAAQVLAGQNSIFQPRAIPAVVFTDPEIAWAGMTEEEAKKSGRSVNVSKFPWSASGRATAMHRNVGLTKLITDTDTHALLGMGIVGDNAGELISEGVLAIEMGATAEDLDLTIHPHPTLSETVMESASVLFGQSTHIYRPRRV